MKELIECFLKLYKYYVIKVLWLVAFIGITMLIFTVLRLCTQPVAMSDSMTDSLQCIDAPHLQRVDYTGFRVYFNPEWHIPACVIYELTIDESHGRLPRSNEWVSDHKVNGCPEPEVYSGSGYDRGHMVPAGDLKWSEEAMAQSFTMTNVCPQNHSLNEGAWGDLEEKIREWVQHDSALIVIAGPIVLDTDTITLKPSRRKAQKGVRPIVPSAFYKIVLAHRAQPMRAIAFIYPNKPSYGKFESYTTTIEEIERLTQLNFFTCLKPDEAARLKSSRSPRLWLR